MKKYKKRRLSVTFIILIAVLCISIGYAVLTTVLKINSNISLGRVTFGIHFANVQATTHKATVNEEAHITDEAQKEISFDVSLPRISDYYKFTTDIVNEGTIPGKVKSIDILGLTDSQKKLISYNVYYTGTEKLLSVGDFFGPNSTKNVTVEVIYFLDEDITNEDLPTDTLNLECQFIINFENGDLAEFRNRAASNRLMQDTHYMKSSSLNFNGSASSGEHQGAYVLVGTENDDFPIYFYRGGVTTPNNVIFANYCWRIIRTTDTGGIKLVYNGTPTSDGQCPTPSETTISAGATYYGGYVYYGSSSARLWLEAWYFDHIIDYQAYIEDTVFCNENWGAGNVNVSCESGYSVAKGNISYPIGLLTADEATLAGLSRNNPSTYSYLATSSTNYATMSICGSSILLCGVSNTIGNINMERTSSVNLRPVIALNSEVRLTNGDGSQATPYKVTLG